MALNPYESPRGRMRARAETTRRQFLMIMGGLAAAGASLFGGIESLKFLFPQASSNAPALFKTSFTFEQLTGGVVNGKAVTPVNVLSETDKRVTVVLDDAGIYPVYLVCTHLGCTPNYVSDVTSGTGVTDSAQTVAKHYNAEGGAITTRNGWACPCHGSRYFIDSTNFYGPAPRPMDWVDISMSPDKFFVVNRAAITVYRQAGDTSVPRWRLDPQ